MISSYFKYNCSLKIRETDCQCLQWFEDIFAQFLKKCEKQEIFFLNSIYISLSPKNYKRLCETKKYNYHFLIPNSYTRIAKTKSHF